MPRCGGCEGVCRCGVTGADGVEVTGNGQPTSPYVVSADLSDDVGNSLEVRDDGLYVGAEIVAGIFVGDGLSGDGTEGDPLTLDDPAQGAQIRRTSQTITSDAATLVDLNSGTDFDVGGMVDPGDLTRLTVAVAGFYTISARASFASIANANSESASLRIYNAANTLLWSESIAHSPSRGIEVLNVPTVVWPCDVGHYFEIRVLHSHGSGSARNVSAILTAARMSGL